MAVNTQPKSSVNLRKIQNLGPFPLRVEIHAFSWISSCAQRPHMRRDSRVIRFRPLLRSVRASSILIMCNLFQSLPPVTEVQLLCNIARCYV